MTGILAAPVFLQLSARHAGLAVSSACLRWDIGDVPLSASALISHFAEQLCICAELVTGQLEPRRFSWR